MKARSLTRETIRHLGIKPEHQELTFEVGDAVEVSQRVKEGAKERTQLFEGDVIAIRKNGISTTFTVRRIGANNVAIERVYPLHSPNVVAIRVVHKGDVRRAKLFYMRERIGRGARVQERVMTRQQKEDAAALKSAQKNVEATKASAE